MSLLARASHLRVHPSYMSIFYENVWDKPRISKRYRTNQLNTESVSNSLSNLKRNTHTNNMSNTSVKKCKRAIDYLMFNADSKSNHTVINYNKYKFKLTFITLTLSSLQAHTDKVIKRELLNQFLINAARLWQCEKYVWRAERQANGNIHFHILFDKFIPWNELRGLWNRLQGKLGYIDEYRKNQEKWHYNGFKVRKDLISKWSVKQQIKAYHEGRNSNWSNPNSTDIHSVQFINNVGAYVTKYMTKESDERHEKVRAIELCYRKQFIKGTHSLSSNVLKYLSSQAEIGRLWGCSQDLSNLTGGNCIIDSSITDELNRICQDVRVKELKDSYYSVILCPIEVAISLKCVNIVHLLSEFMCERFVLKDSSS